MGGFDEHMSAAPSKILAFCAGVAGYIMSGWEIAIIAAIGAYLFVYLGAAFPDIDHHSSIPYRYFKTALMWIVGAATLWFLWDVIRELSVWGWETAVTIVSQGGAVFGLGQFYIALFLAVGLVLIAVMGIVGTIVDLLRPKHRGITHKRGTGILVSGGIALVTFYSLNIFFQRSTAIFLGLTIGLASYSGILSHLRLDGLLD